MLKSLKHQWTCDTQQHIYNDVINDESLGFGLLLGQKKGIWNHHWEFVMSFYHICFDTLKAGRSIKESRKHSSDLTIMKKIAGCSHDMQPDIYKCIKLNTQSVFSGCIAQVK